MGSAVERWERFAPGISWREPIPVKVVGGGQAWCCRVCIAELGLTGEQLAERGFADVEAFERHFVVEHE